MIVRESVSLGSRTLTIESGRVAKQAGGAVLVQLGETVVLVSACSTGEERAGIDFFPLTCDYVEKTFAAGKIPGGFFKREGRPRDEEILTSRLIDRPIRPLFPDGFKCETQVVATVLSVDKVNPSDVLAVTGASAALHLSEIPWGGPIAAVRVGRLEGGFIVNPTFEEMAQSELDIVLCATKDAIVMVEGSAASVAEDVLIDAMFFGHEHARALIDIQERMRQSVGKPKRTFAPAQLDEAILKRVEEKITADLKRAVTVPVKQERTRAVKDLKKKTVADLLPDLPQAEKQIKAAFEDLQSRIVRGMILGEVLLLEKAGGRSGHWVRPPDGPAPQP